MHSLLALRLLIGLAQGIGLYLLVLAYDNEVWPATNGYFMVPLILAVPLIPLLISQALGDMRKGTLILWAGVATLAVIGLSVYDVWRYSIDEIANEPSPQLVAALLIALFISHALVLGGDADRRFIARYETHFDVAWKIGVQAVLAVAFVGVFWGILWLGAGLFSLIDIDLFADIISERWFAVPATTLAASAAIHVTDVRAGLVRGVRTLGLTLLSWLLPLMAAIAFLFLLTLPFTGLQALWDTNFAALLLMVSAGVLVVLINAAYQDGNEERISNFLTGTFGRAAALILVALGVLSAYALFLRVQQYGWTVDRIFAAGAILIACCYAFGYAAAALIPGPRMKFVETWNFVSACVILAVIASLFSPLVDPMRLAVADQMRRLESATVAPEDFDVAFLRFEAGRFGMAALRDLQTALADDTENTLRTRVDEALFAENPYDIQPEISRLSEPVVRYPEGATLPENFRLGDFGGYPCYSADEGEPVCEAWRIDLDGDGAEEIVLSIIFATHVYDADADGTWQLIGEIDLPRPCTDVETALAEGTFELAAPEPWPFADIVIAGQRYSVVPKIPARPFPNSC